MASTYSLAKQVLASLTAVPIAAVVLAQEVLPGLDRLRRTTPVVGTVVRGEVLQTSDRKGEARYEGRLHVRYAWEGKEHVTARPTSWTGSRRRAEVQAELDAVPPGTHVPVWVDPLAPDRGAARAGPARWAWPALLVLVATLRLGADSLAELLANRRRRRLGEPGVAALDPRPVEVEGLLAPRCGLLDGWALPAALAGLAWWLDSHALGPALVAAALAQLGLVAARLGPEVADELRWRRARLEPAPAAHDALDAAHGLTGAPPGVVDGRLRLLREVRELQAEGRVRRLLDAWLGLEWTTDELLADRPVALVRDGDRLVLRGPTLPFGPLGPDPEWAAKEAPLVVDGLERRLRQELVLDGRRGPVTFLWPPAA